MARMRMQVLLGVPFPPTDPLGSRLIYKQLWPIYMRFVINSAGESGWQAEESEKEGGAAENEGGAAEKGEGAAERGEAASEKWEGAEEQAGGGTSFKEAKNRYVDHVLFHLLITIFANLHLLVIAGES